MSEQTNKVRTTQEIQQEYNNLAFKAGHLQYQITQEKKSLAMINETLASLATEHATVKATEDKEAAETAARVAATPTEVPPSDPAKAADASLATPADAATEGTAA